MARVGEPGDFRQGAVAAAVSRKEFIKAIITKAVDYLIFGGVFCKFVDVLALCWHGVAFVAVIDERLYWRFGRHIGCPLLYLVQRRAVKI